MTAEETAIRLLNGNPGAEYWPLTLEAADAARRLVAAGTLAVLDAAANQGRGTYRLNAQPETMNEGT